MVTGEDLPLEPEFIDDIGAFFESQVSTERSIDAVLNEMREKLQQYSVAENRALNRHQTLSQQEVHLKKSLDCVLMLTQKKQSEADTVVNYALGGVFYAKKNFHNGLISVHENACSCSEHFRQSQNTTYKSCQYMAWG